MKPPRASIKAESTEMVAVLAGQGLTQLQIGKRLNISQPTVHRLMAAAEQEGWIKRHACLLPTDRVQAIETLLFAERLPELLMRFAGPERVPGVTRVFYSGNIPRNLVADSEDESDTERAELAKCEIYESRRRAFLPLVASYLATEVFGRKDLEVVGVAWGATLRQLTELLSGVIRDTPYRNRPVRVIPICGDSPEVERNATLSSSHMVARLNQILNGREECEYSFTGVPATIPHKFLGTPDEAVIRDFLKLSSRGYRKVFSGDGGEAPLIEKADMILTAVGRANPTRAPWLVDAFELADMKPGQFRETVAGNIGGLFLPVIDAGEEDRRSIDEVNRGWTGVNFEEMEACAARARERGTPGVTAIVVGKKVKVVLSCIQRGLINTLVMDHSFAGRLTKALEALGPRP